ncbi:MAG: nucleotidyltransferase family protein [bacterium]
MLCAGFATRLRPLTITTPKPLLRVGGRTILDHLLDQLTATGAIDEITLVTNHVHAEAFARWRLQRREKDPHRPIEILDDLATRNETRLGAVRDLALAVEHLGQEAPLLVAAGDNLFDFDFADFFTDHEANPRTLVLGYEETETSRLTRSGVATLDEEGRILELVEKPEHPRGRWVCPPVYLFEPDALAELPAFLASGADTDAPGNFIAWLAARGIAWAHRMNGARYDVGNIDSYRAADAWLAARPPRQ